MATEKQIEANRRNAKQSTGPTTPEGKAASSQNALRHGLRAAKAVLRYEDPAPFLALCQDLQSEWQPQGPTEEFYVEQMAVSQWKLARAEKRELAVDMETRHIRELIPLMDKLSQCIVRLERSYSRAQRELERLQQARRAAAQPQPHAPIARPKPQPQPAQTYLMTAQPAPVVPIATPATAFAEAG
jgi:hypothetical protein